MYNSKDGVIVSLAQGAPGDDPAMDCLDCHSCGVNTVPVIWGCDAKHSDNPNQWWSVTNTSGILTVQSLKDKLLCLSAALPRAGGSVVTSLCNASDPKQQWTLEDGFQLQSRVGGDTGPICLDAGTVGNWSCSQSPNSGHPYW